MREMRALALLEKVKLRAELGTFMQHHDVQRF